MRVSTTNRIQISIRETSGQSRDFGLLLPWGKITIDAIVPLLQLICDNVLAIQLSNAIVSCAAGCAHCCYQLIPISAAEAVFLNKMLQALPRGRRRKIKRDFKSIQDKSESIIAKARQPLTSFDQSYFQMGIACPFLENNRCGIYQQRPLACREYHVDSPSQFCTNPYRTNPRRAVKGLNVAAMLSAFCTHLLHSPEKIVPLFEIDKWGDNHPAAQITFDAEWVFTKLMSGVVKAADANDSIAGIDWQFIEEDKVERQQSRAYLTQNPTADKVDVLKPRDKAKLLVQHANAVNISKIVQQLLLSDARLKAGHQFVEIGAGDGYLRYLGSLSADIDVQRFCKRIIETESDATLVAETKERGKHTLLLKAQDLSNHFGERFTPLIISFNVLDVFSRTTLDDVLTAVSTTLMAGGRVIHIMSSAIHASIFLDIAASNPDKTLLPFYSDGAIGVVLIETTLALPSPLSLFVDRPELLPSLFRQSPEEYLSMASQVRSRISQNRVPHENLFLHEYSMNKLCIAMEHKGFFVEHKEIIDSTIVVARDALTEDLGNTNTITNKLGVMTVDRDEEVADQRVKESSSFGFVVGRKL